MKKFIPDAITLMNLLCGSLACIEALQCRYYPAFGFIIAAACFDFFDGFAARLLHCVSATGKELDSLCDLVSFGLAPSLMMFSWYRNAGHSCSYLAFTALALALFGALRLAKFNTDERQHTDFIGLPIPASAVIASSFTAYAGVCVSAGADSPAVTLLDSVWFIPVLAVVLAALMVSEIPMFSMKHKKLSFKEFPLVTWLFAAFLAINAVLVYFHIGKTTAIACGDYFHTVFPLTLFFTFVIYVLMNVIAALSSRREAGQNGN